MKLSMPLRDVLHTTEDHLEALKGMGLKTVEDLLLYVPRSHEDLSSIRTLSGAVLGEKISVRGSVDVLGITRLRGGRVIVSTVFTDTEGMMAEVSWFNQPHIKRMLPDQSEVVLTGKISEKRNRLAFQSPQFEIAGQRPLVHAGRLVPIYPQHDIINTKWLREKMALLESAIAEFAETLPAIVLDEYDLIGRKEAIHALHFPASAEDVVRAQRRIAFEEMYGVQVAALERKKEWQGAYQDRLAVPMDVELIKSFFGSLHFTPTASQKIAIYEILRDMEQGTAMSRLLEGDVGSGKTLVATAVMATVLKARGQSALMVPTEVLARQHAQGIARLLIDLHAFMVKQHGDEPFAQPKVALLTGSTPAAEALAMKQGLQNGTVDIVIGTHALIEESVQFHDLRLVIVDEQHRFGVTQRARLKEKGNPHFLAMTATPIPRTLALTAYGDHDLSVLLEKPGNRTPIQTKVVSPADRPTVEHFIDHQIGEGRQVFVICPLIAESEAEEIKDVKNVEQEVLRLRKSFPHRRIAMLHGRMVPKEKEDILQAFRNHTFDLLVSTSVIEVGIDIPNSTIIVIEGAERFGLSQLHQFRGRVGRGDVQSHCFLFTTTPEQARSPRLRAMEQHDSGFQLAEIDLRLRGPGALFGLRQSGLPDFQFPQLLQPELVMEARRAAEKVTGLRADKAA